MRLLAIFTLTAPVSAAVNAKCYFPGGAQSKGQACFPDQENSACCGPTFVCLSNGLCQPGPDSRQQYSYKFYRSACTDASWNSTECPQFCTGPGHDQDSGEGLQNCGTDKYCCKENYDCCSDSKNIFEIGTGNIVMTISASGSRSSSTSVSSAGASSTAPVSSNRAPSQRQNTTAIRVGVGLGVGILIAILVGVFVYLSRRRIKRAAPRQIPETELERLGKLKQSYQPPAVLEPSELDEQHKAWIPKEPQELEHKPLYEVPSPEPLAGSSDWKYGSERHWEDVNQPETRGMV
ncbi:hypothetical protein BDV95DRAFT_609919 [Massariosphaeria phaeospora]|uniref:Mid2 domain-containing protein n=1 Tax=Massariosphaeria phaeospora TaxID=100035 RepID=A0A7C8M4Q2_9PLEO|nr:hypothetical protein BDV95DRAFT_609919 [Massariosphaeria phaeospora]